MGRNFNHWLHFLRCCGLIVANRAGLGLGRRGELLVDYLKLKVMEVLVGKDTNRRRVKFLGHELNYFDLGTTVRLIEEIFIENEYYFEAEKGRGRVLDLGGNIGLSVIYFKYLYPMMRVSVFEPDPAVLRVLKANIASYGLKGVEVVEAAVSDRAGGAWLYMDGEGSGSPSMSLDMDRGGGARVRVRKVKLSDYMDDEVRAIKMDAEGEELKIFRELQSKGKLRRVPVVMVEYHHHIREREDRFSELLVILEQSGFGYQISAGLRPPFKAGMYEDIQVFAYRKGII